MYKKFINLVSSLKPDYESMYEVVNIQPIDDDYYVIYRMHGKSGVDKILLSNLMNDDKLLNNFSGAVVRNLTACALKYSGKSSRFFQSTSMTSDTKSVDISVLLKETDTDQYSDVNISELMSDSKKLGYLSKKEIARLYWLSGYKEGYEEHALEQSFIMQQREEKCIP